MRHAPDQAVRVLYVLNSTGGGASLGIYEMLSALPRTRYTPYAVMPPDDDQLLERVRPLFADVRTVHLRWWNVDWEAGIGRRLARRVGCWRRGVGEGVDAIGRAIKDWRIDLVHSGTALTRGGAIAAAAAGLPHLWHVKECVGRNARVRLPMDEADLVRFMTARSARVITMSEYIAAPFRRRGCPCVVVLPDGVDTRPYRVDGPRPVRERLGTPPNRLLVGMVAGPTSTWKRHDLFVRMGGMLTASEPGVDFAIVGPEPSASARWPHDQGRSYFEALRRLVAHQPAPDRIRFAGGFPDAAAVMRSLDVLVHPCEIEPFGRIAIEAMAAGVPVVGPRAGGIAETVVDEETGILVTPGDPGAFAVATRRLIRDEALRRRMGARGQGHVGQRYTIERHVADLTAVYDAVMAEAVAAQSLVPAR